MQQGDPKLVAEPHKPRLLVQNFIYCFFFFCTFLELALIRDMYLSYRRKMSERKLLIALLGELRFSSLLGCDKWPGQVCRLRDYQHKYIS